MATTRIIVTSKTTGEDIEKAIFDGIPSRRYYENLSAELNAELIQQQVEPCMRREIREARVGNSVIRRPFAGDKSTFIRKNLKLGQKYLFTDEDTNLVPIARDILFIAQRLAPNRTGFYRSNFGFIVDDGESILPTISANTHGDANRIAIVNQTDFASTLEKRGWPRGLRKAYSRASRKYKGRADIRFRYFKDRQTITRKGLRKFYAIPGIEIGPLGSMGKNTGIRIKYPKWTNRRSRRNDVDRDIIRQYRRGL
jgi:hypothetical protein